MVRRENLVGNRYGSLVVISREPTGHNWMARWKCRCDCGLSLIVFGSNLKRANTKSCGNVDCLNRTKSIRTQHFLWSKEVRKRDKYICQKCGKHDEQAHAHHILHYAEYPEIAFDVNNGATLCIFCHGRFHGIYGKTNFTKDSFYEFLRSS